MPVRKVVITGPESTGKTQLAQSLANCFNTLWVPEYAREYISGLKRSYNYDDVEHIAREQVRRENLYLKEVRDILFYDTDLIVTKVWFKVVYGHYPGWIDEAIMNTPADLFLVCNTDIPWVPDPLRENGGEMREVLMGMYITEINIIGVTWKLVSGKGGQRINSAVETVRTFLEL
jgi:NadR type nicotinamide-nucleotide adenylyltransferase